MFTQFKCAPPKRASITVCVPDATVALGRILPGTRCKSHPALAPVPHALPCGLFQFPSIKEVRT